MLYYARIKTQKQKKSISYKYFYLVPAAPCGTPCLLRAKTPPMASLTSLLLLMVLSTKNLFNFSLNSLMSLSSVKGVISKAINMFAWVSNPPAIAPRR